MKPMLVVDDSSRIVGANDAAQELLGKCEGRACWDVVGALRTKRSPVCVPGCVSALGASESQEADHGQVSVRGSQCRLVCRSVGEQVVVEMLALSSERPSLSQRERDVLAAVARGLETPEIATSLGIGPGTVRTHVENARRKLGARTRAQAIAIAMAGGELECCP